MADPKEPATLVFQGKHIRVREALRGGETCFVTFSSVGNRHTTGFGEAFLHKRGYSAVHLVTNWDHWYQPEEVRIAAGLAKALVQKGSFKRVITYGASMGGYGAALHSQFFDATASIIIAPQYSIDGQKVPFEKRWRREAEKIEFIHDDMDSKISASAKKYYIYDPNCDDRHHIELYSRVPNSHFIHVPFCGHVPGHAILHAGLLQGLIQDLAEDSFDAQAFRQAIHLGRRRSPVYWHALGAAALRSKRLKAALHAAEEGVKLAPGDLSQDLLRANILLRLRRFSDALDHARNLVSSSPKHPACWRVLSLAAQHLSLMDEAVEAARSAVSLRPHDADLHRVLLGAFLKAGRYEEAAVEGEAAIAMDGNFIPSYVQTAEALHQIGNYRRAQEIIHAAEQKEINPPQRDQLLKLRQKIIAVAEPR